MLLQTKLKLVLYCTLGLSLVFGIQLFVLAQKDARWNELTESIPEPEVCAFCDRVFQRQHPPCIINLSTGQISEIEVFDPEPVHGIEISTTQNTGISKRGRNNGISFYSNAWSGTATATFQKSDDLINVSLYCNQCRDFLRTADTQGYVLLDLYTDDVHAYLIAPGRTYTIRDYKVRVHFDNGKYEIDVKSDLLKSGNFPVTWVD